MTQLSKLKFLALNNFRIHRHKLSVISCKQKNVGENSYVDPTVQVLGWENVRIGSNSILSESTWININHREEGKIGLIIGNNCFIGRRNFFSSGIVIKIGDYCLTTPNCSFLGSDHIYSSPFKPYIATGTTEDGAIELGANCWLGANVTVLKGVKIGYGSIIGASTVVNRDVPPFSMVVGNPCRVIKRFDMQQQSWVSAKDYSEENDQDLMSEAEYIEILSQTEVNMNGVRIASSKVFGDLLV